MSIRCIVIINFKERSGNKATVYKMNSVASIYATQNAIQEVSVSQYETQNATQSATINKTKNQKLKTKNKKEIKKKRFGEFKNVSNFSNFSPFSFTKRFILDIN